jgi:thimet oligopeptidase
MRFLTTYTSSLFCLILLFLLAVSTMPVLSHTQSLTDETDTGLREQNPFLAAFNEPVKFTDIQPSHIEEYVEITKREVDKEIDIISRHKPPTFDNTFHAFDDALNVLNKARDVLNVIEKLSPDSILKEHAFSGKFSLDSLATVLFSNPGIAKQMTSYHETGEYRNLEGPRKVLADLLKESLNWGTSDEYEKLISRNRELRKQYAESNDSRQRMVVLDEAGAEGLPESFKNRFLKSPSHYEIPNIRSTLQIVLANAQSEETRKVFLTGSEEVTRQNLEILNELVANRHKMAQAEGYRSYAEMFTDRTMAGSPEVIWEFIHEILEDTREIATQNIEMLKKVRNQETGIDSNDPILPWDIIYYSMLYNRSNFQVDRLALNPYLHIENCLDGMFELYEQLLDLTFKKVENASVWHADVEMYQVFEGDSLKAEFYLDLYTRPRKNVQGAMVLSIRTGKTTPQGYQIPVAVLVTNHIKPTGEEASLLSYPELSTLFHEFGHVMQHSSYNGEFTYLSYPPRDFNEAMSQIFEYWLEDYEIVKTFARHYETGEILPEDLFNTYLKSSNTLSGIRTHRGLGLAMYDMFLHDKYEPENHAFIDKIWDEVDKYTVLPMSYEGFHPHADNHFFFDIPVYLYTYSWSSVYARDMFSKFNEEGLRNRTTGMRYRDIILSNGIQRDTFEALEEFLGRPSNNQAFINSLGLE